jgi:hypothetical protein
MRCITSTVGLQGFLQVIDPHKRETLEEGVGVEFEAKER